jgi:hypothetical protein
MQRGLNARQVVRSDYEGRKCQKATECTTKSFMATSTLIFQAIDSHAVKSTLDDSLDSVLP